MFAYAPNIFIWYCLLSGLNEGKTQLMKRKLWKWIPTVIERAHSDQSPLWTVIVSVYQVDWQIMHIYKQHLKKTHTYHSLSSSVSLYLSKTQYIHTLAFDFPFKLQRVPRVTMRTGINLTKHQKAALSTQITTPAAQGYCCVYVHESVCTGVCAYECRCANVCVKS